MGDRIREVFSEVHNEVEEIIELDGDTIVSVQKTHAGMRHTELETHFRWATVWTLKDGKALRAHGYLTKARGARGGRAQRLELLGPPPPPQSAPRSPRAVEDVPFRWTAGLA